VANFFKASNKKPVLGLDKDKLIVKIKKLDLNGCGVAYYKNKPIFISGSLANEDIEIKIVEQKNKYAKGKLLKINTESTQRVIAKCSHFGACGGCDLQHLDYQEQIIFKQRKVAELFSRSGIPKSVIEHLPWQSAITSSPYHYRRKARIGVQFDKNAQAIIGFRQKATNQLINIKSCPVLAEPASNVFMILKELIAKLSVKKAIGHIEVICTEHKENFQSVLTLVIRQIRKLNEQDLLLWQQYAESNQWQLFFQEDETDEKARNITSKNNNCEDLSYRLIDDVVINFAHSDFIQVNQQVNVAMVEQALTWLQPQKSDLVLDLFCGLGNFSLPLAKKVNKVVGVEGVQSMVDKAHTNATSNQIDNCSFFQADLNSHWLTSKETSPDHQWTKHKFTKVLLDPARAGAELALEQVIKLAVPTVLYISCDPATLARDSQLLLAKGYKIEKIGLVDMFSQTKHVETMVLFQQ